ncbi:hypothetical protein FGO68_gene145 [Halteria grandinella]|uniref:Elongator complex protein 4 n=1 Tax=Halteria grandinella TaxID=5974 RepID=A0A8J8SWH3_HALGN|nr:hypothetical protein FGO68_gene145 [Halteria grandinella]
MSKPTSFVKKINTAPQLYKQQKGIKPFPNQQYCLSSGTPTLDALIGGGFPLGTLVVLYEDNFSHYYTHFQKAFLGEGVVSEHKCLIIDPDVLRGREYWLKFLPAVYKIKDSSSTSSQALGGATSSTDQKLQVAWRYQHLVEGQGIDPTILGGTTEDRYRFDNSREMGTSFANSQSHQLHKEELTIFHSFNSEETSLVALWEQIVEQVQNQLASESDDRVVRILMPSFHLFSEGRSVKEMVKFLRSLKALVRSLNGVCLISVDEELLSKPLAAHLFYHSDSLISLTSFKDHLESKLGDYDGTLKLLKQPRIHGFLSTLSEFDIYALRLKGKTGIIVEKIHLEPEEDRAGQDENLQQKGVGKKAASVASVQCNPTKAHQIDF